jgi:hypothetical protein
MGPLCVSAIVQRSRPYVTRSLGDTGATDCQIRMLSRHTVLQTNRSPIAGIAGDDKHKSPARRPRLGLDPFILCTFTAQCEDSDGHDILPVMSYLPTAIAALHIVNSLASILPLGEKVGVGVEAAIALCEAIQVRRK